MLYRFTILILLLMRCGDANCQITTGGIAGYVRSADKNGLRGITIKLLHEFSGSAYFTRSDKNGWFEITNILPGGPYTLEASAAGYIASRRKGMMIQLGDPQLVALSLAEKAIYLGNITVTTTRRNANGAITFLDAERIAAIPSVGRALHDYIKYAPQAKAIQGNEGAIGVAGQNNRFNSFYIDGAVSNDVFGLTASGTNGGQSGISPLPVDAVEQVQVSVSPFDVSMGNFTGAGVNAVTRSGTNKTENAVYYYFSNALLAGKLRNTETGTSPTDGFMKRTIGLRMQGPFRKNSVFYFLNFDLQHMEQPQAFSFENYTGDTRDKRLIEILSGTLRGTYYYNPGNYLNNPEVRNAARLTARIDWVAGTKHKCMFSYRHTDAGRENTNASSGELIQFSNNGYHLQNAIRSASFEIKTNLGNTGNRLMTTYTYVSDERKPLGAPFPKVRINDGDGAIVFGTDGNAAVNDLRQYNWTIYDRFGITRGVHMLGGGVDCEYNRISNAFVQNAYGAYTFSSLANFLTNQRPSYYQFGYATGDRSSYEKDRAFVSFSTARFSFFISDKIRASRSLSLTLGLRFDKFLFMSPPLANKALNDSIIPILKTYRNLEGFGSGRKTAVPLTVSPRLGFSWSAPGKHYTIHGGTGFFTGRIPLAWPGNAYLHNGGIIKGFIATPAQLNRMRFRPNPFSQWTPGELNGTPNNIPVDLLAPTLHLPQVVRSLVGITWSDKGWLLSAECLLTQNITEMKYTNANLAPPFKTVSGPDNRWVYTIENDGRIPVHADGSNPYSYIILLENEKNKKGNAINYTLAVARKTAVTDIAVSYNFCSSFSVNDGTSSISFSQWRFMETVNGRNETALSRSDFSSGHKISLLLTRRFSIRRKSAHTITIAYTGESGQPFSYVYGNAGMVRDDGSLGGNDLVYLPTNNQLAAMAFVPIALPGGGIVSAAQQKQAFEQYISTHPELNARRGGYAGRNIGRTPFTHVVDLAIKLEWKLRWMRKEYGVQVSGDLYNFLNFMNPNWGHHYLQPNDNYKLVKFMGYQSENNLVPSYQFDPELLKSPTYIKNNSFDAGYSSRWLGQVGLRLIF